MEPEKEISSGTKRMFEAGNSYAVGSSWSKVVKFKEQPQLAGKGSQEGKVH